MRLLDVEITNFQRVGKKQKLKLSKRGLVCIVGENGAGKTTIEDSIIWAFTGKTLNGLKGNDVVNEATGRNCHVGSRFRDAKNVLWRVDRYRRHIKHRNKLFLWQHTAAGWVDKSKHMMEDTEAEIRKLTRLDYTALMVSMVVGQGALAPFSAMTTTEQSKVIDNITGNDIVQSALKVIRDKRSTIKGHLDDISHEVVSLATQRADALVSWRKARKNAKDEAATRRGNIERAQQALTKARGKVSVALAEKKASLSHAKRVVKLQKRVDAIRKEFEGHDVIKTEYELELRRFKAQLDHYDKASDSKSGFCDYCGSKVNKMTLAELYNNAKKGWRLANTGYLETADKLKVIRARWDALVNTIRELESKTKTSVSISAAHADVSDAEYHLKSVKNERPTWSMEAAVTKRTLKKRMQQHRRAKDKLASLKRRMKYLEHADQEYSRDIPLDIQDASLPFLNKKAVRYSKIITDGVIDVEFATDKKNKGGNTREGMCVNTRNVNGGSKYVKQSKGEKQKVDLVVASSIQALSNEMARAGVNAVFYDEPFDALDAASVERVMQFLQEELKSRESVFVITHNKALESHFNNVIQVYKQKGNTIIMEG